MAVVVLLSLKETELPFLPCCGRGEGVLDDAGKCGISHDKTTKSATFELMGEQTEGVGIALEVDEVAPELRTDLALQLVAVALSEECLDGLLTTMSERRIAQVVSQTSRSYNLSDLLEEGIPEFRVLLHEFLGYIIA